MSRNSIYVGLGLCMLALVIIMGFLFREPVDSKALLESGQVVTGSLDPSSPPLPGILPPVDAFVMSGGNALPVTTVGDTAPKPSTVAQVVSDAPASSTQMVTAPPANTASRSETAKNSAGTQAGSSSDSTLTTAARSGATSGSQGSAAASAAGSAAGSTSGPSVISSGPTSGSTSSASASSGSNASSVAASTVPPTVDPGIYAVSRTYGAANSATSSSSTVPTSAVPVSSAPVSSAPVSSASVSSSVLGSTKDVQEVANSVSGPMVETIVVEDPALARNKPVVSSSSTTVVIPAGGNKGTVSKPGQVISNATIRSEPNPEDSKKANTKLEASKAQPAPAEAVPAQAKVLTTVAKATPQVDVPTVSRATLTMDGESVVLRLQANAPISGKSFLLYKPNRAVLDLPGAWNVPLPRVPSNRMIKDMRVGKQEGGLRLVMDMRVKPNGISVKQIDANTLELHIK